MVLIASPNMHVVRRWSQGLRGDFVTHAVEDAFALEQGMTLFKPPVLLLDLALLRSGRIKSISALQRLSLPTKVIVFSANPNDVEAISVLRAGAKGYCSRQIEPGMLKKAVGSVQKGEIWAGRKLIPQLIEELTARAETRQRRFSAELDGWFNLLTYRQRQIAALVSRGARNKEIATKIQMSEKTVKAHLTAIFRKLGVANRIGLALLASEQSRLSATASKMNGAAVEQAVSLPGGYA
jgi:DNA-binding NarL/FixJ family response regulator